MLRFGIVTNIDESKAQARVQFQDSDGMVSYWLSILQSKTYKDKFYILPDLGEHVVCLMDKNIEEGVILGSIYSEQDACPVVSKDKFHIRFEDGTVLEYDKSTKKLSADIKGTVDIKALNQINLTAPIITVNGSFNLEGNAQIKGNVSATGSIIDAGGNSNHHAH